MRRILMAAFLSSCAADHLYVGVSRGRGTIDGECDDYDVKDTRLEVGAFIPLPWTPEPRTHYLPPPPSQPVFVQAPAASPVVAPAPAQSDDEGSGIPWETLATLVTGALGYKGSEIGVRRYNRWRSSGDTVGG